MKSFSIIVLLLIPLLPFVSKAQDTITAQTQYRNFPIIVGLQFQNLAMPFHDLKSNFTHPGLSVGTELGLNKKKNLLVQLQTAYYRNKEAGNGFFICTQFIYRPVVFKHLYSEIKAGIGWQRIYHPVQAYEFKNGNWVSVGGGKSQLIVPLGISIGYNTVALRTFISPFISYQVIPALFYDETIPLNFYSLFQFGTRIHLIYNKHL